CCLLLYKKQQLAVKVVYLKLYFTLPKRIILFGTEYVLFLKNICKLKTIMKVCGVKWKQLD
ncbi:MAG: hypothetical protein ACPGVW_12815, partial [Pseudoalteromonas marina]